MVVKEPFASVSMPAPPNGQYPIGPEPVRHSPRATNEFGAKLAPLTVTSCPWPRPVSGVTEIVGGRGGGTLASKLIGVATTTSVPPNTDVTIEHAPGALAQSKSPPPRCRMRRTENGAENVPAGVIGAKSVDGDWLQSS